MKGEDLHADVMVSFDEAAFGGEKLIHIGTQDGSGQVQSLQVHIPVSYTHLDVYKRQAVEGLLCGNVMCGKCEKMDGLYFLRQNLRQF